MARDYLEEAFKIHNNESKMKPRKEHISALVVRLTQTMQKTQKIAMHLEQAILNAENKKRQEKGQELLTKLKDLPKHLNGVPLQTDKKDN